MREAPSRQQLLYDAATRFNEQQRGRGPQEVIEAAVNCLVDGIDSDSLRMLAGAWPKDSTEDLRALVEATLLELGLPAPGEMPRTKVVGADGALHSRFPHDTVRFEVRSARPRFLGHEVVVYVNDVEITRHGAGMGMSPFDLLIPENRLVATDSPRQLEIARCNLDECGCGATDVVTVVRDGERVHWDWELTTPISDGVTFEAVAYDAEVARIGADRSWERGTAARLLHASSRIKRVRPSRRRKR